MKKLILCALMTTALAAFADKQPLERYQSIIDRQMFGPVPEGFDPTKPPSEVQRTTSASAKELTKEQEKLQSAVHFSMINVTPDGSTAVGFTDSTDPKTPINYYLKVGESRNGWTVKEADPVKATMTIVSKDGIEVSLAIGGNSGKGGGTTSRAGASPNRGNLLGAGRSLGERRRQRLQREQAEQKQRDEAAEARRAEQEAQRQAREEEESKRREAERAEQREQLKAIQEELKRVREEKAKDPPKDKDEGSGESE